MDNMRWVTRKPPVTFVIARMTASMPSTEAKVEDPEAVTTSAPTTVIPLIAFDPDMSGV